MNSPEQELPANLGAVEADYQARLADLSQSLSAAQWRQSKALTFLIGCALLLILGMALGSHYHFSLFALVPALGTAVFLCDYVKSRRAALAIAHRCGFYERGIDRVHLKWDALPRTGKEFAREGHLYQYDLQIIGERSLFSLLCTTRSEAGAARLAEYLLQPSELNEVIARQGAVRELRASTTLRENIALLGRYHFLECDPKLLGEWMNARLLSVHPVVPITLLLCGSANLLLAIFCLAQFLGWMHALPFFLPLLAAEFLLCSPLFRGVRTRLQMLRRLTDEVSVLQQGLQLLERQQFTSRKLVTLVGRAHTSNASRSLLQVDRLLRAIAQREKDFFALPSLLTASGTQLVLAVERWRAANRDRFQGWIDTWAEFDALNAIACYACEHADHIFPEIVDGAATLHLREVGHPLLPVDQCTPNDIALNESCKFWILSGSNMAGKSTLLRAIGTNIVLACAGAPIRAVYAQFSLFTICGSISVSDSLLDGKSKFLAEAERLQRILEKTQGARPVLFLIDEILSGTNSHDRHEASAAIVRALIERGAVGILSTHDLALTSIADEPGLNGTNCCMESVPDKPLTFDYVVKPGISRTSNAIAIIRSFGVDV